MIWNGQLPLLPNAHIQQTQVPSLDHPAGTKLEAKGLVSVIRGVELLTVRLEGPAVIDVDSVAYLFRDYGVSISILRRIILCEIWVANRCLPITVHLFGLEDLEFIRRNRGEESRDNETGYG